ncbi:SDR family NAD(P)-dependent oxidoreductase [Thauera butanivorans]|uniref:SDR family NAD(P)-dependent oxidoreductase n=1 Tax=Thauera butanivorans TaxID=86174 RepID=UPI000838902E|nr:SDR family NAD(P)-dependent oxidoreductase [Thauera butanivorans]
MTQTASVPSILIVGASRGIGLGLVREYLSRGWRVIATERKPSPDSALDRLAQESAGALRVEAIDIDRPEQIAALSERLQGTSLDVLLVNAGVIDNPRLPIGEVATEEFVRLMVTNALSPLRVIEALAALVKPRGSIAAMSSGLGSIAGNTEGGSELYRASKATLNMLLRSYTARAGGERTVLALMPGWVRTDMGGPDAAISVEESAKGLADTIARHQGERGTIFVDYQDKPIPW